MADLSIGVIDAAGATRQVDVYSQPNGDLREAVVIGDGATSDVAGVVTTTPAAAAAGVVVRPAGPAQLAAAPAAPSRTVVSSATTSQLVWADTPTRLGGQLYNATTGEVHLSFATSSEVATADVIIPVNGFYELMSSQSLRITQPVSVIWAATATGTLRCVEWR